MTAAAPRYDDRVPVVSVHSARFAWMVLACCLAAGGCATSAGPAYLTIDSTAYAQAFDAAIAAARANDMPPALRDRRLGVIETTPSIAGSILEPWRSGNASLDQAMENTVVLQRRRARFEFTPATIRDAATGGPPDLLGLSGPPADLTSFEGAVELRVSVIIERAYSPGIRRSTWSGSGTSHAVIRRPASDPEATTKSFWAPVARDTAFEKRLLALVARTLTAGSR